MESRRSRAGMFRGAYVCVVASIAALALAAGATSASAAAPVLEFVSPGHSFPIPFEAEGGEVSARLAEFEPIVECSGSEGEGVLTGPRSAVSSYFFTGCAANGGSENGNPCQSEGAEPEEIDAEEIDAELVYVDQAKHEVAMLLNPGEGEYMNFECGGETVAASGSFLSPVDPINSLTTSFTAILHRSGASQLPSEYENANGEKRQAIPMGQKGSDPPDMTGVELSFTIHTSASLEIKAINTAEIEAKKRDEEATKKHQEEEVAKKKSQEEELAKKKLQEAEAKAMQQHLTKALRQCRRIKPGQRRSRCVKRAHKKFGTQGVRNP